MSAQRLDFTALKQSVSIWSVLDRYGLLGRLHRSGESLSGPCPLHNGHNPTQFRVSISRNCWHCFGDCQAGGSILDFVSRKEGVNICQAALLIREWFALLPSDHRHQPATATKVSEKAENRVLPFQLTLDHRHPYLAERGLAWETICTFSIGYCAHGSMRSRIAIPIHNRKGDVVAYAGRWPGEPPTRISKYLLPRGFRKSLEIFNIHRAMIEDPNQPLILVEGFFGCMALWQAGFKRTVALMGSSISESQKQTVCAAAPNGKVTLLFDGDESGRKATENVHDALNGILAVRVVALPDHCQPDHLKSDQICALLT